MSEYLDSGIVVGGRYRVEQLIGEGGMAAVYSVRHAQLNTQHALKVLTMQSKSVQRRLMQEGRVQAAIKHPNILSVTDVVDVEGAPGLVMEFIRGPALDDFLLKKRLTVEQLDSLVAPILDGVAAAHGLGLIHRDLKPANVMLSITPGGLLPKVADFGLVKLLSEDGGEFSKTRSGMAMGTPAYMAPEQIRDAKNVDARADIWSLGAILYEMASGQRAFDQEGDLLQIFNKVASGEFPPLRDVAPELPERIYEAVEAAMTVDREQRIGSVLALRTLYLGEEATSKLWSDDLLSAAESMGGHGDETTAFLQQSFRSQEAYRAPKPSELPTAALEDQHAETYYPDSAAKTGQTGGTLDFESVGRQHEHTLPEKVDAATVLRDQPESDRRMGLALVGVGVLGMLGGLAGVGLLYNALYMQPADVTDPPAVVEVAEPVPVEAVEPTPAAAEVPVEVAPEVVPKDVVPTPKTPPRPVPVAVEPEPTPAEPEPVEVATASPPESAGGTTEEARPVVTLNSDASVFLIDGQGRRANLDALDAGTYTVTAVFDPANPDETTDIQSVTLTSESRLSIKCLKSQRKCKVSQ
ncbi:MAG: serine/threonine protein kinase [Proteobacteria bacterium]|nr:serine/threonine protein kinase [Pseudomonadota bacterium]